MFFCKKKVKNGFFFNFIAVGSKSSSECFKSDCGQNFSRETFFFAKKK